MACHFERNSLTKLCCKKKELRNFAVPSFNFMNFMDDCNDGGGNP